MEFNITIRVKFEKEKYSDSKNQDYERFQISKTTLNNI